MKAIGNDAPYFQVELNVYTGVSMIREELLALRAMSWIKLARYVIVSKILLKIS